MLKYPTMSTFLLLCLILAQGAVQVVIGHSSPVHHTNLDISLEPNQTVVFKKGELDYFCFRIPVLYFTSKNTLLAFAEGRGKHTGSCADHGDVHIVVKRSTDLGKTWSQLAVVYSEYPTHTIGNPSPVEDKSSDKILLVFCRDNKDVLTLDSSDDGLTWANKADITTMVRLPTWSFIGTGPPGGLQLPSGRLILCVYASGGGAPGSFSIFSDDGGKTWLYSQSTSDPSTGECQIAPLDISSNPSPKATKLIMSMRTALGARTFAYSNDSGESWYNMTIPLSLNPQNSVEGSLLAVTHVGAEYNTHLYVSQPRSLSRTNMTFFHSTDGGHTWKGDYLLWGGPSGYSSMVKHNEKPKVYCLYERGLVDYFETLTLAVLSPLI